MSQLIHSFCVLIKFLRRFVSQHNISMVGKSSIFIWKREKKTMISGSNNEFKTHNKHEHKFLQLQIIIFTSKPKLKAHITFAFNTQHIHWKTIKENTGRLMLCTMRNSSKSSFSSFRLEKLSYHCLRDSIRPVFYFYFL